MKIFRVFLSQNAFETAHRICVAFRFGARISLSFPAAEFLRVEFGA